MTHSLRPLDVLRDGTVSTHPKKVFSEVFEVEINLFDIKEDSDCCRSTVLCKENKYYHTLMNVISVYQLAARVFVPSYQGR